jgi:hypothetical protein
VFIIVTIPESEGLAFTSDFVLLLSDVSVCFNVPCLGQNFNGALRPSGIDARLDDAN